MALAPFEDSHPCHHRCRGGSAQPGTDGKSRGFAAISPFPLQVWGPLGPTLG